MVESSSIVYTGGKHDGSPLDPPVLIYPSAFAGGRSTDGPIWIECVADDIGATFMDYAVGRPSFVWFILIGSD